MGDWISVMFKSAQEHPGAMLVLLVLAVMAGAFRVTPFVMSSDFNAYQKENGDRLGLVEHSLCNMEKSIDKASIDTQLRAIEAEIWQLQSVVESDQANERDRRRLYDLRGTERGLNNALNNLKDCPQPVKGRLIYE